jgi:hypothetical protein
VKVKGKGIVTLEQSMKTQKRNTVILYSFFNLGARWSGCSAPRPDRFTPGKYTVPIVQEAAWASELFWTGAENIAPTWIRSLDSPLRSEPLYGLSYPASILLFMHPENKPISVLSTNPNLYFIRHVITVTEFLIIKVNTYRCKVQSEP